MLKLGVSYYGNRIPWRVKEDLKEIKEAGCTYVVHTFSEEDLEFYLPAMAEIVNATHELGMEVWLDPWGVGQAFGGETYSSLIAKELSVRQISSDGASLPIACPNHPLFREFLLKWIQAGAKLKTDLLFWDEPHFIILPEREDAPPKLWACRCPVCQELFKQRTGRPMPDLLTPEVRAFKEECLVECTRFLCDATRAEGLKSSVCLLPFKSSSTVNNWSKVAQIPSLGIFGTDPYWQPHQREIGSFVGRFAKEVKALADQFGKEGMLWILNFKIPKGEEGTITEALEAGYAQGIRNFAAWSYYGAAPMNLRAEDPAAVWKTLSAAYQEFHRRKG
ncbi:MAG: hypothetical protein HY211_00585 [Candidatus Omnitrophica bacterium]|nr:hypothetical protein [Candidatus Omnitrophota bacterium]